MQAEKVSLTGVQETLLITLFSKAGDSRLAGSVLRDRFAAEIVERIDYDFARLKIDRNLMVGVATRAHVFDDLARAFLAAHPEATVLHLGCGLDSRVFRIDAAPAVRWFDVDFPEIVALRRKLYPDRPGYSLVGTSVTDPAWLAAIPTDRPALVILEGLLPYLDPAEVSELLRRLTAHLPTGEIILDGYSRFGLRRIARQRSFRKTGATLRWALDDPRDLERQVPRLQLSSDLQTYAPRAYSLAQIARMSLRARLMVYLFKLIPALPAIGRIVRYRF